jgi:hypothetical protein
MLREHGGGNQKRESGKNWQHLVHKKQIEDKQTKKHTTIRKQNQIK